MTLRHLPPSESEELVSFDEGYAERAAFLKPDRYWMIEGDDSLRPRIARGGGYSYAAASFGGGSVTLEMTRFNRLLSFEDDSSTVRVEAGMTLGELLQITGPRGYWLPVQPGYPAITIGGCIAANVHGKNPYSEGTFVDTIRGLTLFHPRSGTIYADRDRNPEIFELTCGGYGLTGVILSADLNLSPLPGSIATIRRIEIASLREGFEAVLEATDGRAFAYTWHDGVPRSSTFGRGFVYVGEIRGEKRLSSQPTRYRTLDAQSRRLLRLSLMDGVAGMLTSLFWRAERRKTEYVDVPLFDAMFPFARRGEYFLFFGRKGLAEYQMIIPLDVAPQLLDELEREILLSQPALVMVSMKLFRGDGRLLRFGGDGVCLTLDLARTDEVDAFLSTLDVLCTRAGGKPNPIKDSRLPGATVRAAYPEYEEFRERLLEMDSDRVFRSELSERLGL